MAIKVYIDQGHNPESPNAGAEGNGLREQDITYRVGQALAALLAEDGRFEVRLSRPTPFATIGTSNTTSLTNRVNDANSWGADYFISIHTNASDNPTAGGVEAFAYQKPSPAFDLATDIAAQLAEASGFNDRGAFVRTNLYVLRRTQMPAVLAEIGFISNPAEAALMDSSPQTFARGIYRGLLQYLGY